MRSFRAMFRASVVMLARNRILIITSLGIALISILVFGSLFSSGGSARLALGVVPQDSSPLAAQVVAGLRASPSLAVSTGTASTELAALRRGDRNAVIVLGPTFGADFAQGAAQIQVYYDESNPVMQANARMAVQSIVAGLNQSAARQAAIVTLSEQAVSVHAVRQVDWLTPGQLGMMLMWANLGIGGVLVGWRRQGIMRRLAATPLRSGTLVGAQVLARLVISVAQAAILLGVAMAVFDVPVGGSWALLGLVVALGALTMLSLGFVIGSFAPTQDAAQAINFLISFPMMFLGGSYFPTSSAPPWLAPVIHALPLTHLNDALRQIINNGASFATIQTDVIILLAWLVAALVLSVRAFRWT
ncbi:MAG TPA: ABC transporter permease [Ktedonobacterales bacterium]